MVNNTAGKKFTDYKEMARHSEMRKVWLPETRLGDMDMDGIDAAVLFGGGPLGTMDSELYIASYDAYNHWLWDYCGIDRRRLTGVAYLPMRDIDETLIQLRKAAKLGHHSINIPAFPQAKDGISTVARLESIATGQVAALTGDPNSQRSYSQPEFDRFWAEVQDLDVTVTVHLGGRIPRFGNKDHFLADMPMSKLAMAEPIGILIFGCVFQRFPKLRFVTAESGVGWFSWAAEYMDRTWQRQRFWTESKLKETPSFYWDQNVYGSFIQDRAGILMRDRPGGHNIMWSSDYPHSETTFPSSHEIIARDFDGVPEVDLRQIVCERAAKVYQVG
jgi:predicted TIM-barrel fold metal-dependent hydrolase